MSHSVGLPPQKKKGKKKPLRKSKRTKNTPTGHTGGGWSKIQGEGETNNNNN